ncbi:ferritin-like protein [Westerdykella ornata]|uniref:Ferritin n=1 Tax=Westerdykella ornata TaxID=318751 RepID=A0A6A6JIE8_WESOR|nr:ferritin-like protein [Westerdykella ornata]KAF2275416.1 ferritin-like protein [Westerdykella ornata]
MSHTEDVQKAIKAHSDANTDNYIKVDTFNDEVAEAVRGHIHLEWKSWFFFRKLSADCARANVSLHGFGMLFKRAATECFADGMWLEGYLVQRGGRSKPSDIPAPDVEWPDDPVDPVQPVYEALQVEKCLLEDLQRLCAVADKHGDYALEDVIETRFLKKETKHVKDMGDLLQQSVRVSKQAGHGLYHLDKELRENKGVTPWGKANNPDNTDYLLQAATADLSNTKLFPS